MRQSRDSPEFGLAENYFKNNVLNIFISAKIHIFWI